MYSMTGFGGAKAETERGVVSLELSSVNHRYQEISARLPREFASLEPWLHAKLRGLFRRGKVTARVEIARAAAEAAASVNREVLEAYYKEISAVRDALGQERDISLDALINLPGVLDNGARDIAPDGGAEELLSGLIEAAAAAWNEMRATEGRHLADVMEANLAEIERISGEIAAIWEGARDAAFAAMMERVNRALEKLGAERPDENRVAQEAVIISDRWDIAEELDRLASHVRKFREASAGEAPGRKLDFLAQEMNREANTISSKAADSRIRWLAVDIKTAVERVREQVQNIE